jgi:hypothetical protein
MKSIVIALITGTFVLSAALANAQEEKKKATVRIKKVEKINGVEKITDTTYTTDDVTILKMEEGTVNVKECTGKDGKVQKIIMVGDNAKMEFDEKDNAEINTVIVNSTTDGNDKPVVKRIIITNPEGKEKTTTINVNEEMSPEEQKIFNESVKNGMYSHQIVINEDEDGDKKGESKMTKIIMIKRVQIIEPTADDTKMLSKGTGISDGKLSLDKMNFYPNPNTGKFNLSFTLPEKKEVEINILNMEGKNVYSEKLGNFSGNYDKEIDISKNPKGVYFVKIQQGDHSNVKKIVLE